MGQWASEILTQTLPMLVLESLFFNGSASDAAVLERHLNVVEDQEALRSILREMNLVAFVANGSLLPRQSGASDLPMDSGAVPFRSPPGMEVEVRLPHAGAIRGMGIRTGVTVIVGGGFHGKSTLLEALQFGVYDKVPGDGREYVSTDALATKIRAEDGRQVTAVDISTFISNLPQGKSTTSFSSRDASGSTSQAAAIVEALEAGARVLLIDEDTTATNFMIRDARMQALVSGDKEPIKPFITRVRALYEDFGVSTIVVIGGSGDYFDVADCVVMMDEYVISDVTARAKEISASMPSGGSSSSSSNNNTAMKVSLTRPAQRRPRASGLDAQMKVRTDATAIRLGDLPELDISYVEQIVERSQVRAIAEMLLFLARTGKMDGRHTMADLLNVIESGMRVNDPLLRNGTLAAPRMLEVAAALSRFRSLDIS